MTAIQKKGGKPSFTPIGQRYLQLSEATAMVCHVCEQLRNNWGSEYTVVITEGPKLKDCSATQCQYTLLCLHISAIMFHFLIAGLAFWKSLRRKLYAVTFSDLQQVKSGSKKISRLSQPVMTHFSDTMTWAKKS